MVRASFGGGSADFVYAPGPSGYVRLTAANLNCWDSESAGTRLTDLLLGGAAVDHIAVGPDGQIPSFQGPDGVLSLWVDAGGPARTKLTTDDATAATDAGVAALVSGGAATRAALKALLIPKLAAAPTDHTATPAYLDVSVTPPVLKGWDGTSYVPIGSGTGTGTGSDASKVPLAGGTMTGPLVLAGDPATALGAATRQYVLARVAELTSGSPAQLDTFLETYNRFLSDETALSTLTTQVGQKAAAADLTAETQARQTNDAAEVDARNQGDAAALLSAKQYGDDRLDAGLAPLVPTVSVNAFGNLVVGRGLANIPGGLNTVVVPPVQETLAFSAVQRWLGTGGGGSTQNITLTHNPITGGRTILCRTDSPLSAHRDEVANNWDSSDYTQTALGAGISGGGGATSRMAAPSNPDIQWMLALKSILRTDNGGKKWTVLTAAESFPNDVWRGNDPRIAIDPRQPYHAIVGTQYDGMIRFTDGQTPTKPTLPIDPLIGLRYWDNPGGQKGYGRIDRPDHKGGDTDPYDSCPGVNAILFDPSSPATAQGLTSRVWAFIAGGGVLRSDDAGATWAVVTSTPYPLAIRKVSMGPNGDLALTSQAGAWSLSRAGGGPTGGTYKIVITDATGATVTTAPIDYQAQVPAMQNALRNAAGAAQWKVYNYVDYKTWTTINTIDFLIELGYAFDITKAPYTLSLDTSGLVGGTTSNGAPTLVLRQDTVANPDVAHVLRYRPSTNTWKNLAPLGADGNDWVGIGHSTLVPGLMVVGSQGNASALTKFAFSTNYGDAFGGLAAPIVADAAGSDVPWMANLVTSGAGTGLGSVAFDDVDPKVFLGAEGIGAWKYRTPDPVWTNSPNLIQSAYSAGIEQLVENDGVCLPAKLTGEDTRIFKTCWDRGIYVLTKRGVYPSQYFPAWRFTASWCAATIPGDDDFVISTHMDTHDGVMYEDIAYTAGPNAWASPTPLTDGSPVCATFVIPANKWAYDSVNLIYKQGDGVHVWADLVASPPKMKSCYSLDRGDSWLRFPDMPKNASGRYSVYSYGMGQVVPLTRDVWLLTSCGSLPVQITKDGGAHWAPIVLPGGVNSALVDTTQYYNYSNRRAIANCGGGKAVMMVKGVGVFSYTVASDVWVKVADWSAVKMGTSNDAYNARLTAVDPLTGRPGGGENAHLWWISGNAGPSKTQRINRSTDGGSTWQVISGTGTASGLAFGPKLDGTPGYSTFFVGVDLTGTAALMFSHNQGGDWTPVGGKLYDRLLSPQFAYGDPYKAGRFYVGTVAGSVEADVLAAAA